MKKRGLGKGLEALLGDNAVDDSQQQRNSQLLPITQLEPNPYQPRTVFDETAIQALADSIRQHGIIQPLAVRPAKNNADHYEIIAGERRFRAAQIVGLTEVPVIIHDISDADSAAFALIENLQREDLNIIEKAKGIRRLIDNFNLTHEACGQVLGQSRSAISNTLRLLDLSDAVQSAIADKSIDMGHARALLSVDNTQQQHLLKQIQTQGLSVRETEELVRNEQPSSPKASKISKSDWIKQREAKLSEHLQTKVNISQTSNGNGKITLVFSDEKMLEKLTQRLGLE